MKIDFDFIFSSSEDLLSFLENKRKSNFSRIRIKDLMILFSA